MSGRVLCFSLFYAFLEAILRSAYSQLLFFEIDQLNALMFAQIPAVLLVR